MYTVEVLCEKNVQLVSQTSTRQHTTLTSTTTKTPTPTSFETKSSDFTSDRPQTNVLDRSAIVIVIWFSIYM